MAVTVVQGQAPTVSRKVLFLYAGDRFGVYSAGTEPKEAVLGPAIFINRKTTFRPFDDPAAVGGSGEHVLAETRYIRDEISIGLREGRQTQPQAATPV